MNINIFWEGKAVSVNRWHCVRAGKISPTREYEGFIDDLAWTIRAQTTLKLKWINNLLVFSSLPALFDDQNLLKPVCDAIQRSGLIGNDRNIGVKTVMPAERHKRGKADEIRLFIVGSQISREKHTLPANDNTHVNSGVGRALR